MPAASLLHHFLLSRSGPHRDVHSFPTRRSSDLNRTVATAGGIRIPETCQPRRGSSGTSRSPRRSETSPARRTRKIGKHTSELQSHSDLVCRLLLEKKKTRPLRTTSPPTFPRPAS